MNPIMSLAFSLQKLIAKNQMLFIRLSYLLMIGLIAVFSFTIIDKSYRVHWNELGEKSATISLVLFWITLLPGILKRFQISGIFLPIRVIIILFRKEIGILMYLFAITHYAWSRFLPVLTVNGDLLSFNLFELFGVGAFILAFPMFITSNDLSINKLGKVWHTIHSATYAIVWLLLLHIGLQEIGTKALITLVIACLTLISLFKKNK